MHTEFYTVPQATVDAINEAHAAGGRVIAVGTTSTRSLESAWDPQANGGEGAITARNRDATSLYLLPGSTFHVIDGNHHELPCAQEHAHDARKRVLEPRAHYGGISPRHREPLPYALLRRRHVHQAGEISCMQIQARPPRNPCSQGPHILLRKIRSRETAQPTAIPPSIPLQAPRQFPECAEAHPRRARERRALLPCRICCPQPHLRQHSSSSSTRCPRPSRRAL